MRAQSYPSDILHGDVMAAIGFADFVDMGNVGMSHAGSRPGLLFKARHPVGLSSERLRQDFQRYLAPQPLVADQIDIAHAAAANPLLDDVGSDGGLAM